MYSHLFAEKCKRRLQNEYFSREDMRHGGSNETRHHNMRQKLNEKKLCRGVTVSGIVGRASVRMRMCNESPVDDVRMNETGYAYPIP
jgi:hypothetical protein